MAVRNKPARTRFAYVIIWKHPKLGFHVEQSAFMDQIPWAAPYADERKP